MTDQQGINQSTRGINEPGDVELPGGWEQMLREGLVTVPPGFEGRVLSAIANESIEPVDGLLSHTAQRSLQVRLPVRMAYWLALLTGSAVGGVSVTGFMFGIWSATLAG
jgi:hypothetical protein